MRRPVGSFILVLATVACSSSPDAASDTGPGTTGEDPTASADTTADTGTSEPTISTTQGADGSESGDPTGATPGEGVPCDVDAILQTYCRNCHGAPPIGANFSLLSREDLLAPAASDMTQSRGQVAVARMQADVAPMPPLPATPPAADEIAVFAAWVGAGMPAGDCMPDDTPGPFDLDPVCTSREFWDRDDDEGPRMHPGRACITCHTEEDEGPDLLVAGTVYPTGHEPDDCLGVPGVLVEVTDANDQVVELFTNQSGNFLLEDEDAPPGFEPPYLVKVVTLLGERVMPIPAESGNCNSCHTQDGDEDAPGRIVVPW